MSYTIVAASCPGCAACVRVCPVMAISGEKKQAHRIDPAMCIDCGACGRICPYQAILDETAELCQMIKRSQWPQPRVLELQCVSCGVCLELCPTSVLDFTTWVNHRVRAIAHLKDPAGCIGCAFCEVACPVEAIEMQAGSPV